MISSNGPRAMAEGHAHGCTRLHLAALQGNAPMVELLLGRGISVNPRDSAGQTPLCKALSAGHRGVAELLQRHGAEA